MNGGPTLLSCSSCGGPEIPGDATILCVSCAQGIEWAENSRAAPEAAELTSAEAVVTVRLGDVPEVKLFIWELRMLADEMRVAASPYAERLERALDRFTE
jgi:hypothetical protein